MTNGMRKVAILCGNGGVFLPHELERGADGANTGYAYPEMLVQLVKLSKRASGRPRTTCSTGTCRCCATSSSPACWALAVRKYILKRRGAIAVRCAAQAGHQAVQKKPIAEIEFLIARLERQN